MPETGYVAVFLVGLLGGTHCAAMCGGIVSALTAQMPVRLPGGHPRRSRRSVLPLHLAYNIGRIGSYTLAGAMVGAIGSVGLLLGEILPVQMALYVFANLMLVALGLYLTGVTRTLALVERLGQKLWTRI
ncbi:MAG: sulfite exporter TauE/SafE family protein, partial [Rhodocyclaceae bacterium]